MKAAFELWSSHVCEKRSKFLLPFVFDCWPCCCCRVSSLVNSIKDQTDKLANLGILVALLSDICEENAKGCTSKEMFEVKHARGDRPHFSDGMGFYLLL